MGILLKIILPLIFVAIVVVVVTVPVVLHFRNTNNAASSAINVTSQSTMATISKTMSVSSTTMTNTVISVSSTVITTTTSSSTMSTSTITTTMSSTSTTITSTSPMIQSQYSSMLSSDSSTFCRYDSCDQDIYYYEAIQFVVPVSGDYTIVCNSSMDTYGYLYNNTFNPTLYVQYQLTQNDDSAGHYQFRLMATLQNNIRYIVVATTYDPSITGAFSILATGPAALNLSRVDMQYNWTYNSSPSLYSVALTSDSIQYCRTGTCTNSNYFVAITPYIVDITGLYSIVSNSSMHMYCGIYDSVFMTSNPAQNLLLYDDGITNNNTQFNFTVILETVETYVFAMTTYDPGVTGNFTFTVELLASVSFNEN